MNRRLLVGFGLLVGVACAPTTPAADPPASARPSGSSVAGTTANTPASPVTMTWAYPAATSQYWHLFIAAEKGMLAAEGINLELLRVTAGNSAMAQAVSTNAYPLASISGDVPLIAIEQSAPLVLVAGELQKAMYSIVTQPDLRSWDDFRGQGADGGCWHRARRRGDPLTLGVYQAGASRRARLFADSGGAALPSALLPCRIVRLARRSWVSRRTCR